MKNINKIALATAKIMEILHWLGAAVLLLVAIFSAAAGEWFGSLLSQGVAEQGNTISVYGFEVAILNAQNQINTTTLLLFSIAAVIIFSLMAMCFRNVYLIIKKSQNSTPFQKDNIRMIRELGIFFIAMPVVGLLASGIIRLITGVDAAETAVNLSGFAIGILFLCLTQFFAHGMELEEDVDGLV